MYFSLSRREIKDEYLVTPLILWRVVARIIARRLTWAGHLFREMEGWLQQDWLQQDFKKTYKNTDHGWGPQLDCFKMHQTTNLVRNWKNWHRIGSWGKPWRRPVVEIEPEDTLELQKKEESDENKKLRSHKCNGSWSSQWMKGVNRHRKFDGGLITE